MRIFLKYILNSMVEKKGRFILLTIAIALSSGLFVAICGAINIAIDGYKKPMTEMYEQQTIGLKPINGEKIFSSNSMNVDGLEKVKKEVRLRGKMSEGKATINIIGREDINKDKLLEGSLEYFENNKILISKRISKDKNLKVGDTLKVSMYGEEKDYLICGILNNEGQLYLDTKDTFSVIVPYKYLDEVYKLQGKYNYITATAKDQDIAIKNFNENNKEFQADKLYNVQAVKDELNKITMTLYIMLVIVVIISIIIIYGAFKLITTEILPVIGTFISLGANNTTIERMLFFQSMIYGIVGGIFGNILGVVGLYTINYVTSPLKEYGIIEKISVNPIYFILGMIFAIVISIISATIPVMKVRLLQVKDVILNTVQMSLKISIAKSCIGIVLILTSIFIVFINSKWTYMASGIFVIISLVGLILFYPKVIDVSSKFIYKYLRGHSKILLLGLNNFRTSKILMGNVTLVIISLISIFLISSLGYSLTNNVVGAYKERDFNIAITDISSGLGEKTQTDSIIDELINNQNVIKNFIVVSKTVKATIGNESIHLEGIDKERYDKYNRYLDLDKSKYSKMYNDFKNQNENCVIISEYLKDKLKVKDGDVITINYNNISKNLKVFSSIEGKMYDSGRFVLIDNNIITKEFNVNEASSIIFNTNENVDKVKDETVKELKDYGVTIRTNKEIEDNNHSQNAMIITSLSMFSYIAMIIAALGIFNNIIIGFLQRKKELTIYASLGMKDRDRNKMLIVESLLLVFWSIVISIPYSFLGIKLLNKFLIAVGMSLNTRLNFGAIPIYSIVATVIVLVATLPTVFKSNKLSIVQELKYE